MIRRLRSEQGFGLVELLAAMVLIEIAIFALFAAFTAGTLSTSRAGRTSSATVVGEKQLELYRAMLYEDIGLSSTALGSADGMHTGDPAWSEGTQFASTACASSSAPECQPVQAAVTGPDGRSYRVDTYVRELTPGAGGIQQGRNVKRVTVVVRWNGNLAATPLARLTTTFDRWTGCIEGSTLPAEQC